MEMWLLWQVTNVDQRYVKKNGGEEKYILLSNRKNPMHLIVIIDHGYLHERLIKGDSGGHLVI